jgi:hypothetical protein
MAREGTRSQTGHATPRVFHHVDTAPVVVRKKPTKAKKPAAAAPPAKASKPTGVTKKKAPAKKPAPATKVCQQAVLSGLRPGEFPVHRELCDWRRAAPVWLLFLCLGIGKNTAERTGGIQPHFLGLVANSIIGQGCR